MSAMRVDVTRSEQISLELSALFEAEAAGVIVQHDLEPYTFNVLAVCTGNICRSPLIEVLMRDRLSALVTALGVTEPLVHASSSGLGALVGAPADQTVLELAREAGVDLSAHRARQFEPSRAENAHLILAATTAQRDEIVSLAPSATTRCFSVAEFTRLLTTLGDGITAPPVLPRRPTRVSRLMQQLVDGANSARQLTPPAASDDIDDPYRQSLDVHIRVAKEIVQACSVIETAFARALGVRETRL